MKKTIRYDIFVNIYRIYANFEINYVRNVDMIVRGGNFHIPLVQSFMTFSGGK